jgi:hypothetical protein
VAVRAVEPHARVAAPERHALEAPAHAARVALADALVRGDDLDPLVACHAGLHCTEWIFGIGRSVSSGLFTFVFWFLLVCFLGLVMCCFVLFCFVLFCFVLFVCLFVCFVCVCGVIRVVYFCFALFRFLVFWFWVLGFGFWVFGFGLWALGFGF